MDYKTVVSKTAKENQQDRKDAMTRLREKRNRQYKNEVLKTYINMRKGKHYIKGIMQFVVGSATGNST